MSESVRAASTGYHDERRIFSNFVWFAFDRASRMIVSVVVSVLVARHLGPVDFGVLSFGVALAGIFAVFGGLGLESVVVRDLVRGEKGGTWRAAWQLRIGMAVVAYVLMVAVAFAWRPDSPHTILISAILGLGLLFGPADLIDAWFQAHGRIRRSAAARQIVLWMSAGWRLWLVWVEASVVVFAVASVIEAAAVAVALRFAFRGQHAFTSTSRTVAVERRRLLAEGAPLMLSGLLVTITLQVDRLLLGYFQGNEAVGTYAAAARLTELFHVVPLALGAAIMPRLTSLRDDDEARYWAVARTSFIGLALAGLVFALAITFVGPWLVPALFGASYTAASPVLSVHAWTLAFVFMVSLRSRLLVIEGGTRWVLAMSLLTALLNVTGNLFLIPRFGGVGAAWAAVLAWSFAALGAPWFFAASRGWIVNLARGGSKRGYHI